MKVLITGANGFTGSYLAKLLNKNGFEVVGLVREQSNLSLLSDTSIELRYTDLARDDKIDINILKDIDTVYHIAAAYRDENVHKKYFWDVNFEGTKKLLKAAKVAGINRFVHCSTVGVQGEIQNPPAKETDPYNPGDHYQESKVQGEIFALDFYKKEKLPISIVRPVGIYGPGDMRFLKLFKFIHNGTFRMIGSGKVLYHLTYVEDLVQGIFLAGIKQEAIGEIFTIGGEGYLTLQELVDMIAVILDKKVSKLKIPFWPAWMAAVLNESIAKLLNISPVIYRRRLDFFSKDRAFDISKAKKLLGYFPKMPLEEGLRITAEWYKSNGFLT